MATVSSASSDPSLQSAHELIEAIIREAEADADRVVDFVRQFGLAPSPLGLNEDSLLSLGAALRLASWERLGIRIHLDAGLPPANELIEDSFRSPDESGAGTRATDLSVRVLALFVERFAWHGCGELGATVVLDPLDEDHALDALAELLWDRRRLTRGGA